MQFLRDRRKRAIILLGAGVFLIFAVFGWMQAFRTSNIPFLNPETAGETLAFTGLTVIVFLLLLTLLMLLLRNILKLYAGQSSSALGSRLRTRMVLGAVLIALAPAVFMFLFSFQLMNRSLDRWFSPNTSELREDSTRVVLELAQYVANNARGEAESIAATGGPDRGVAELRNVLGSHRITLQGGFAFVFDKDRQVIASYEAPPENSPASLIPWMPDSTGKDVSQTELPLSGPLSQSLLTSAQHNGEPVVRIAGQEYALGISVTATGKAVVAALPMPRGIKPDDHAHPRGGRRLLEPVSDAQATPLHVLPDAAADHGRRLLLECLARALPLEADHAPR